MQTPIDFQLLNTYISSNSAFEELLSDGNYTEISRKLNNDLVIENPAAQQNVLPKLSLSAVTQIIQSEDSSGASITSQLKIGNFSAWLTNNVDNPPGATEEERQQIKAMFLMLFPMIENYSFEQSLYSVITELINNQERQAFGLLGNILKTLNILSEPVFNALSVAVNATVPDPEYKTHISWVESNNMTGVTPATVSIAAQGLFNGFN